MVLAQELLRSGRDGQSVLAILCCHAAYPDAFIISGHGLCDHLHTSAAFLLGSDQRSVQLQGMLSFADGYLPHAYEYAVSRKHMLASTQPSHF